MDSVLKTSATAKNLMRAFAGETRRETATHFPLPLQRRKGLPVIERSFIHGRTGEGACGSIL